MEKEKKKSFLKEYLITAGITLVIGVGLFFLFFFVVDNGGFVGAIDGTGITGLILISIGLLIFVSRQGFFDIFSYGFKQMGSMMFSRKPNENNDFAKYQQDKRISREKKSKYYLVIVAVGVLFVTAFIIIKLIFDSLY